MTPHNEANIGDIAKTVIMPGDPLRAKYIAENFLEDYKLVNSIRGMYAYTGKYKGKVITVMAHGMGIPSIGIYCFELYKFYKVENIIRIGSCGAYIKELDLFDIILSKACYSESNFAMTMNNEKCHMVTSSEELNSVIEKVAEGNDIIVKKGNTVSSDCFGPYMTDNSKFLERIPKEFNPIAIEMEAFALFYIAKKLNKKASCLMSVVDSEYVDKIVRPKERETKLNNMIILALEAAIKI